MPIVLANLRTSGRPAPIRVLDRFEFDSSAIRPFHLAKLRHVAIHVAGTWKSRQPVSVVTLVGHADSRGSDEYNRKLGLRRADAAARQLVRALEGVEPGLSQRIRLDVQSLGEARPVADKQSAAGRALNRRVEVFLSY